MSRHIGDENTDTFLVDYDEIVKISGNRGHRDVTCSNV